MNILNVMNANQYAKSAQGATKRARYPDAGRDTTCLRSAERAFAVIDAIASEPRPKGLSDLARTTGLAKSTMHRILRFLLASELIAKSGGGYVIGKRMTDMAWSANSRSSGADENLLMPFLVSLYDATHAVVTIATLNGRHAIHREKLFNHDNAELAPQVVRSNPASLTSSGKVLLAHQRTNLPHETSASCPESVVSSLQLQNELAQVRRTGLACSRVTDSDRRTVSFAAAPIFGPEDEPVEAFSVTGIFHHNDETKALVALRQSARAASLYLRRKKA